MYKHTTLKIWMLLNLIYFLLITRNLRWKIRFTIASGKAKTNFSITSRKINLWSIIRCDTASISVTVNATDDRQKFLVVFFFDAVRKWWVLHLYAFSDGKDEPKNYTRSCSEFTNRKRIVGGNLTCDFSRTFHIGFVRKNTYA